LNEAALVGLLNNAALLMALVLLFDLDFMRKRTPRVYIQSIAGIIVGLLGIGVMLAPWEFAPGVYLDTRSVLLSVAGLHFGAVPTAIAVVITVAFRLLRGGPGVAAGIIVIVTSGAIGVAWRHVRHRFDRLVPAIELYLLGFMIHVPTLIFLTLTDSAAAGLATEAAIACLIGYPVTTILVGSLLNARQSRHAAEAFVARRQVYDQAMAEISARFVATGDLDTAINASLAQVGQSCRADRVHVFQLRPDGVTIDGTHEWCAPGVEPLIDTMYGVPAAGIAWWSSLFTKGESVLIADAAELPEGDASVRRFLASMGIVSIIALPLQVGSRCSGFIGLHRLSQIEPWDAGDLALARVVTQLLSGAIGRAQADAALTRQAVLLNQVQDLILATDLAGEVTYANDAMCRQIGAPADQVIGRSVTSLPGIPRALLPMDEVVNAALERGQWRGMASGLPPGGRRTTLDVRAQIVRDRAGEAVGYLAVGTDVSERVRTERSLRLSEARYRGLFDNSPVSLWEEDLSEVKRYLDGLRSGGVTDLRDHFEANPDAVSHCLDLVRIIDVNQATLRLYEVESKEDVLSSLEAVFIDASHDIFREELVALFDGQTTFEGENIGTDFSGDTINVLINLSVAPGCEETWDRVFVAVSDITERVQTEEALRRNQSRLQKALDEVHTMQEQLVHQERMAAVGQLSAGIAHDFNNIMAAISLYTQLALRDAGLPDPLASRLRVINDQVNLAADLVEQMLDFGRQSVIEREALEMGASLTKSAVLLEHTIPADVTLVTEVEPGDHIVMADPSRVQQAVLNLALNARDAMPDGGRLRIALSSVADAAVDCISCGPVDPGDWVVIEVTDTGAGIAPDVLPHIFEPFFTTRAPVGHGLGLAQVYGIVNQHGGHIEVETALGKGTTFRLYWPACC